MASHGLLCLTWFVGPDGLASHGLSGLTGIVGIDMDCRA